LKQGWFVVVAGKAYIGDLEIKATNENGDVVGDASAGQLWDGVFVPDSVGVIGKYRRQGVASAMYDSVSKLLPQGSTVDFRRADVLTENGKDFRDAFDDKRGYSKKVITIDETAEPYNPIENNASGESAASLEAISDQKKLKAAGIETVIIDTQSGIERPAIGMRPEDNTINDTDVMIRRSPDGTTEVIQKGVTAGAIPEVTKPIQPVEKQYENGVPTYELNMEEDYSLPEGFVIDTPAPSEKVTYRTADETGYVTDGKGYIKAGDVFKTATGRLTTPFPKQKADKYVTQWLIDNAVAEAESRGDRWNADGFRNTTLLKRGNLTPADSDSIHMYLYGKDQPVVPKPFLKDLVRPSSLPEGFVVDSPTDVPSVQPASGAVTPKVAAPAKITNAPRNILTDIQKAGGIKMDALIRGIDKNEVRGAKGGNRYLKVTGKNGVGLDQMAQSMLDQGWNVPMDLNGNVDVQAFTDMLKDAVNGNRPVHPDDVNAMVEKYQELPPEEIETALSEVDNESDGYDIEMTQEEVDNALRQFDEMFGTSEPEITQGEAQAVSTGDTQPIQAEPKFERTATGEEQAVIPGAQRAFGKTASKGGRQVGTSELMDEFTPDPQADLFARPIPKHAPYSNHRVMSFCP